MSGQPEPLDLPEDMLGSLYRTVFESQAFKKLLEREYLVGSAALLEEILDKKLWSNEEIVWVLKQMVFFYGKNDSLLKKTPVERLFLNVGDILRALYLLMDRENPELDENTRSYICAKIGDATWGITDKTRIYLQKMP